MFILNPHSGIPIYRQLVDQITRLVNSGQLAPGDSLPSVRELAQEHAINPMTISKAYGLLESSGLLQRNRGKPMTVAPGAGSHSRPQRIELLAESMRQVVLAARQLELAKKDVESLLKAQWESNDE